MIPEEEHATQAQDRRTTVSRQVLDLDDAKHLEMKSLLETLIHDQGLASRLESQLVNDYIGTCLGAIRRLRMGGRSTSLTVLCILLWAVHERGSEIEIDVEEVLAKAFDICRDPSYVRPEWGVVLIGVLVARYLGRLPEIEGKSEQRKEIVKQCRMMLRDLDQRGVTEPVKESAGALLNAWDAHFPRGLTPVVKAGLNSWPDIAAATDLDPETIRKYLRPLSTEIVTCDMTKRERVLYRALSEMDGKWAMLESIAFV